MGLWPASTVATDTGETLRLKWKRLSRKLRPNVIKTERGQTTGSPFPICSDHSGINHRLKFFWKVRSADAARGPFWLAAATCAPQTAALRHDQLFMSQKFCSHTERAGGLGWEQGGGGRRTQKPSRSQNMCRSHNMHLSSVRPQNQYCIERRQTTEAILRPRAQTHSRMLPNLCKLQHKRPLTAEGSGTEGLTVMRSPQWRFFSATLKTDRSPAAWESFTLNNRRKKKGAASKITYDMLALNSFFPHRDRVCWGGGVLSGLKVLHLKWLPAWSCDRTVQQVCQLLASIPKVRGKFQSVAKFSQCRTEILACRC